MKTRFMLFMVLVVAVIVNAQSHFPHKTVEERVKTALDKIAGFKLDNDKEVLAHAAFIQFYRAQEKVFEDLRNGGGPIDRDQVKEKMEGIKTERDDKLKQAFTRKQFKKWKDEIEPALEPRPTT